MPENIECQDCGRVVFGVVAIDPKPADGEECPDCGGTDFQPVE
jgi:DNA-directed RNA polymerase subunit RPC12/RpoP